MLILVRVIQYAIKNHAMANHKSLFFNQAKLLTHFKQLVLFHVKNSIEAPAANVTLERFFTGV